jgi:hypothetical protein
MERLLYAMLEDSNPFHCPDDGGSIHTSETLVNFNVTAQRYIPEDSELQGDCN